MADDEDNSSSSDNGDDHATPMTGESRSIAENDESYTTAVADLSSRDDDPDNGYVDDDEDCFDEVVPVSIDNKDGYDLEMCNTIAGDTEDTDTEEEEGKEKGEDEEEAITLPKTRSDSLSSNSQIVAQVPVSPVSADKPPCIYLGQQAANCAKVHHLSMTTCQEVMREILKHKNPRGKDNQGLQDILKQWEGTLSKKRKGNQHVGPQMTADEKKKLFSNSVTYDKLDMTLMYKIARNLLHDEIMSPPGRTRWEIEPPEYNVTLQACIERLNSFRKQCSHRENASFSDEGFRSKFQYIRNVIVQIEKHLGIEPQYSLQVDYIQNAQLSPDVAALQDKLKELESEREALKNAATTEVEKVRENLEKCLEKYCIALGMFNENVNGQDAQTRKCIENHESSDRFYAETKLSKEAMRVLKSKHHVLLTGNKGCGKTALGYHLLYQLMPLGRCTVHVLDSLSDIRKHKINTDGFVIALIELAEIKSRHREDLEFIIKEFISSEQASGLYIIMTTKSDNVDDIADLTTRVDMSDAQQFALDEDEKMSILEQQLNQVVKKTGVPLSSQPTPEELTEIAKESYFPIEFPLAASLFAQNEKYRRLGPPFFRSPVDYLLSEIESFCKVNATFVLLLQLVFQDTLNSDDISGWIKDPNAKDPEALKKAGKRINGHITLSSSSGFQLRNQCVKNAICIYIAKEHLPRAIKHLDQEYVVDTNILSCRAENTGKCIRVLSDDGNKTLLAERFFREMLADKTANLSKSDAWLDDTFIDIFIDVLVEHISNTKEDDKVAQATNCIDKLFHWAVSHRCMLLCKSLRKHMDSTCIFDDALPDFTEDLMTKFMSVACTATPNTLCVADREVTKIELLRFFVEHGTRCICCTAMVECGDDESLRYILCKRVMDPTPEWGFWEFLTTAAIEGDTLLCNCTFVKLLISQRTESAVSSKENEGIAAFAEKVKSLKDDNSTNKQDFFFSCIETIGLNHSLMMAMKKHQFPIRAKNEEDGNNGLHIAITTTFPCMRQLHTITALALTELDLQQDVNKDGETPLMVAVQRTDCDVRCIAELLRQNADPNYASPAKAGYAALHLCITSSLDDETVAKRVSTLIEYKADVTKRSQFGETPISLAISKGKSRLKTLGSLVKGRDSHAHATQYMLHYCIQLDLEDTDKEAVVIVLINEGVSVNETDDKGRTPIMVAIQKTKNNTDLVEQLLNKQADVTITDHEGLSPLHHCCKAEHTPDVAVKIARWLMQGDPSKIEAPDQKRKTPLMHAITNKKHSTADLVFDLIEKVTQVNAVDSGGNTVMHLSMESHFEDNIVAEVAEKLMNKAADPFVPNNDQLSSPMCGFSSPKGRSKSISRILEMTPRDSYRPHKDLRGRNILHLCVEADGIADEDASTICKQAIMCGESAGEMSKESKSSLELAVSSQSMRLQTICSMLSSSGMKLTSEIYDMLKRANKLSYELLQLLLQHKIELDEECREAQFPFHDIIDDSQTSVDDTIVSPLIRLGFDINKMNSRRDNAVMAACRSRCPHAILVALANESDVTTPTHDKETYLHVLAKSNRSDVETCDAMKSLMKIASTDPNVLSKYKRSALAESVIKQKINTVQFLIQKGADPNRKDRAGKVALHHCVEGDWFDDKACRMLDILIEGKACIDICDNRLASALDLAASNPKRSRLFSILRLLELGSDVETVDYSGKSPMHNCLIHLQGHRKSTVVERTCRLIILRLYGGDPFSKDDDGKTAVNLCDRLDREKRLLLANTLDFPRLFEEIVKDSFASLEADQTFSQIDFPVNKLKPGILHLMQYSSKFLHREVIDSCEDEDDLDTMTESLDIREFEPR